MEVKGAQHRGAPGAGNGVLRNKSHVQVFFIRPQITETVCPGRKPSLSVCWRHKYTHTHSYLSFVCLSAVCLLRETDRIFPGTEVVLLKEPLTHTLPPSPFPSLPSLSLPVSVSTTRQPQPQGVCSSQTPVSHAASAWTWSWGSPEELGAHIYGTVLRKRAASGLQRGALPTWGWLPAWGRDAGGPLQGHNPLANCWELSPGLSLSAVGRGRQAGDLNRVVILNGCPPGAALHGNCGFERSSRSDPGP